MLAGYKLPLDEIRVSITEMRERKSVPGSDGGVTLPACRLATSTCRSSKGYLNRSDRAPLRERGRVHSLERFDWLPVTRSCWTSSSEGREWCFSTPTKSVSAATPLNDLPSGADSEPTTVEKRTTRPAPQRPRPPTEFARPPKRTSSTCPAPGDTITRTGKLSRIIDNDSFELVWSDRRNYVVYVGSATRVKRGSRLVTSSALREGLGILVKGTVAAGPEDECSIGAREVIVQRQ